MSVHTTDPAVATARSALNLVRLRDMGTEPSYSTVCTRSALRRERIRAQRAV